MINRSKRFEVLYRDCCGKQNAKSQGAVRATKCDSHNDGLRNRAWGSSGAAATRRSYDDFDLIGSFTHTYKQIAILLISRAY
jgi:hypothetical protein